jgi:DNA-binding transcriptional regulator YdaS (Cro superfamily)
MLKKSVIEHFGSQNAVAVFLRISSSAVSQWKEVIPERAALKLSRLTKGKLKYQADMYEKAAA